MFQSQPKEDFQKLIETLNFQQPFNQTQTLVASHLYDVQSMLADFVKNNELPENIAEGLKDLPSEGWLRLVSSPYLAELLMLADANEDIRKQILLALHAEIIRSNPDFKTTQRPPWTINGDTVLDPEINAKFPALQSNCGIQLNYQSYVHNTGKVGIGGYSFEMALKHKERIDTGREIVKRVSPSADSLIETFTTIIQFRINETRTSVVNSSTHTSIGLIRCDNFHKIHNDMPEIVDMLVHESIHQYLHLFEEQLFDFINVDQVPKAVLDERALPSPWSGNLLDLRSYTHAILVWYGLVNFWKQFIDSGYTHPEVTLKDAQSKLSEAMFGFVNSQSVLDNLGFCKQFLNEDYSENIKRIQDNLKLRNAV